MLKRFKPTMITRALFFFIGDFFISFFTLYLSYLLRFNFSIPKEFLQNFLLVFAVLFLLKTVFMFYFRLYHVSWRFFSLSELKKLLYSHILTYISFFLFFLIFKDLLTPFPRSVIIIDFFLSLSAIGFFRISKRFFFEKYSDYENLAIVVGANEKTLSILKQNIPYKIKYIYEDDKTFIGTYISGLKICDLNELNHKEAETVIITKEYPQKELDRLFERLKSIGFKDIKIYNPFEKEIKDISIEDLLARKPKDLDKKVIAQFIKDKNILVTGAGGSIGSEICRQCVKFGARRLILVDNCEYNLYSINEELKDFNKIEYLVDVSKFEEIKKVFQKEKPDIVIHAAAYKHVPLCEANPRSAVINNIFGTKNVMDLAIEYKIKKFILISTDKAVRPTNIMGATKRVCELYAQNVNAKETEIVAVRFGNVLGSSGSVIPKFKEQIKKGGPLTVTHPEVTRYFMLIPEACQLVLQAAAIAKGGEIFILDMGEPVKIVDLAKKMLKLYGKENEIDIVFTGLRPGEKLFEELLLDETEQKTKYNSIFITKPTYCDIEKLNRDIEELRTINEEKIIVKLKEIVKEFNHQSL